MVLNDRQVARLKEIEVAAKRQGRTLYAYHDANTNQDGSLAGIYSTRDPLLVPAGPFWAVTSYAGIISFYQEG